MKLRAPATKVCAQDLQIPVYQPVKVRTGNLAEWLAAQHVQAGVVMAYGRILPPDVLVTPARGCLNLHASLLPKYRGAAPINWALYNGETSTGISLMQMDEGLDTGPVFRARSIDIAPEHNAADVAQALAALAAEVVREDLPRALDGTLHATPQDEAQATHAPLIEKHHLRLDWSRSAQELVNQVRAFSPAPGARTRLPSGKSLKVLQARALPGATTQPPGTIVAADKAACWVQTGAGQLELQRAQLEGKRTMSASELVNGRMLAQGWLLGGHE